MKKLTLVEAIALKQMSARTIKRWYEQGYFMAADGLWYSEDCNGKVFVKYSTH